MSISLSYPKLHRNCSFCWLCDERKFFLKIKCRPYYMMSNLLIWCWWYSIELFCYGEFIVLFQIFNPNSFTYLWVCACLFLHCKQTNESSLSGHRFASYYGNIVLTHIGWITNRYFFRMEFLREKWNINFLDVKAI